MATALREVFADGTPCRGAPIDLDAKPAAEWVHTLNMTSTMRVRHKILANPPAATTHKAEQGAPWRRKFEEEIDSDNARAQLELQKKRETQLAVQMCKGLASVFNVNYDVTEFSTILRHAYQVQAAAKAKEPVAVAEGTVVDEAAEGNPEDTKALLVLEASLKFDLPSVIRLLDLKPADGSDQVLATRTLTLPSKK